MLTTPLVEQLAIAQQIEVLQQQQQQIAATHQQYVNMGMIQPQQHLPANFQMQGQMPNVSPNPNQFQFAQQMPQQHLAVPMNAPSQPSSHRRNQSALPNVMGGPPPAPSSGASGFGEYGGQGNQGRENVNPRGRGGGGAGSGHTRRHSLALPEAKKAAELAEQKRKTSGFQFPIPGSAGGSSNRDASPSGTTPTEQSAGRGGRGAHGRSQSMAVGRGGGSAGRGGPAFSFPAAPANDSGNNNGGAQTGQSDFQRRGSQGHGRSQSRNFEGNWRQPQPQPQQQPDQNNQAQTMGNFNMNQTANAAPFQPGHRTRGSVNQSVNSFQYPGQQIVMPQNQVLLQQQMLANQGLNPLQIAHLQALQAAQMNGGGFGGMPGQHGQPQMMQQQQQQRKTLFTPYLPQATLPALLSDGQLVAGILRVNKKNRSDAYVTTTDLDADIFICGSKDRNRALEGDLVAVELLDVDEVWGQKREKEEKKKRKDNAGPSGSNIAVNDATTQPETSGEGGIRRRGSLRQRPTQKKNDDVEVEGQSLLLMEEEEINDEQKPLYAGHIVAVIERVAGQMFSG